ncbi:ornithine decarboxylase-like [Etheostoma cragini]|uniref:ornithine decarboxylase-like n=1 Tax=Etheostoma cragini TaxID=417921 RepID=UPI00155E7FA6|nr:ornithine decarboxylase-like [Etheostoma cragini]
MDRGTMQNNDLSLENCDIDILDNGRTNKDVIDNKIKELGSVDNEEPFYVADLDSMYKRHAGSVFKQAIADARHVFDMANLLGFQMRLLDIGGGFSAIGDFKEKFEEFSVIINEALDELFPPDCGVQIIAEPGRYYVESAFTLAANVIAKRVISDDMDEDSDREESLDRMMMYYLNDGVYGSMSCIINDPAHSNLKPYLHRVVDSSERRYCSVIWGPTCDSFDKVTDNYWISELHVGDWLLVDNMGAYTICSCTDFNSFERAHIYTVVTAETWHALNLSQTFGMHK